ncbi:hypothetical protein O181_002757 [Austropuccinia psidii MF-1]|uniref:Uncharacterized protein n=1 Tax=Austropuccinia psidii MF-1 TaxID=1389203 RepID=A0A9Q3BD32_9BASI|nr:hypothetical protein [Austropuccinia psidii MF-1]
MTHNQIGIGCDRYGTPNPHKTVTSIMLDCQFILYSRKYGKSTTWTLKIKNPEHSYDSIKNIIANPAFRKFNEQKTSQIPQMSESLLIQRQIQAQLCSQRESESLYFIKKFTTKSRKSTKTNCKAEVPLILLLTPSKKKILCGPLQGMLRDTLPPCFSLTPFP